MSGAVTTLAKGENQTVKLLTNQYRFRLSQELSVY